MLSPQQRKVKLESLLDRVQRNRSRVGTPRAAAAEPAPAPPVAAAPAAQAVEHDDDDIDFGFHEGYEDTAAAPGSQPIQMEAAPQPTPDSIEQALDSYTPAPMPAVSQEGARPSVADAIRDSLMDMAAEEEESGAMPLQAKTFSSSPPASGPVVETVGNIKTDWTLQAVLERAWKFGAR